MKKELRSFSSIALMLLLGSSALPSLAQQKQPAPDHLVERAIFDREIVMTGPQGPGAGDFVFLATEMSFGGKLVKGTPFSAEAVTESVQTLTDGNRIINKSTAAVYRDSEGRTRREQTLKSIGPFATGGEPAVTVFINDPVAGTSYTLDPRTQTAQKMTPMRFRVAVPKTSTAESKPGETREAEARYREGVGQVVLERTPGAGPEQYQIAIGAADARRNMEVGAAMGITSTRNRSARTESLGKQNIGGVEAEGTRNTVTVPAGEIGNERAIEMVSERWYSPELQVIVMTRHTDPRFGENSYQLTNINRSEPSRELFEVPPGYTVKEVSAAPMGAGGGIAGGVGTGVGGAINGGVLNRKATTLPLPEYPEIARQAKASGPVTVQVMIDEGGNVISANAVAGHPLLRAAAVKAAREAKFSPTRLSGEAVRISGLLTYNFIAQ